MSKLSHKTLDEKRVLFRADFDVAMYGGKIQDDFRIRAAIPSIRFILKNGGLIRIVAHLDRPHGKVTASLSMRKIARYLSRVLNKEVVFIHDPLNNSFLRRYNTSPKILFFENIRFWSGEEKNNAAFARQLSRWGDLYVNDAFAVSHRTHASVAAVTKYLPSYIGLRFEEELRILEKLIKNPRKPFVVVVGGAKLETKIPLVKKFLARRCWVLAGGAIANTFLHACGISVGKSRIEARFLKKVYTLIDHPRFYLPDDVLVAADIGSSRVRNTDIRGVRTNEIIFDIGPRTAKKFGTILKRAKTIFWNGPLGFAEFSKFASGTRKLAHTLQEVRAFSVVGGGDTVAILKKYRALRGFDYISTGGGATLEYLAGKKLPGLEALKRNFKFQKTISKQVF